MSKVSFALRREKGFDINGRSKDILEQLKVISDRKGLFDYIFYHNRLRCVIQVDTTTMPHSRDTKV